MTGKHLLVLAASMTLGLGAMVGCEERPETGGVETPARQAGEDIGDTAERASDRAGEALEEGAEDVQQGARQAGERMGDTMDRTGDQMQQGTQDLRDRAGQPLGGGTTTQPATSPTTPQR